MTDVPTSAPHDQTRPSSPRSPSRGSRSTRLRSATRLYVVLAVCASALIVAGHAAGDRLEQAERQGSLAMVGAGRDPGAASMSQAGPTGLAGRTGPAGAAASPMPAKPLAVEDTPAVIPLP
jgi:hypothetical protein